MKKKLIISILELCILLCSLEPIFATENNTEIMEESNTEVLEGNTEVIEENTKLAEPIKEEFSFVEEIAANGSYDLGQLSKYNGELKLSVAIDEEVKRIQLVYSGESIPKVTFTDSDGANYESLNCYYENGVSILARTKNNVIITETSDESEDNSVYNMTAYYIQSNNMGKWTMNIAFDDSLKEIVVSETLCDDDWEIGANESLKSANENVWFYIEDNSLLQDLVSLNGNIIDDENEYTDYIQDQENIDYVALIMVVILAGGIIGCILFLMNKNKKKEQSKKDDEEFLKKREERIQEKKEKASRFEEEMRKHCYIDDIETIEWDTTPDINENVEPETDSSQLKNRKPEVPFQVEKPQNKVIKTTNSMNDAKIIKEEDEDEDFF